MRFLWKGTNPGSRPHTAARGVPLVASACNSAGAPLLTKATAAVSGVPVLPTFQPGHCPLKASAFVCRVSGVRGARRRGWEGVTLLQSLRLAPRACSYLAAGRGGFREFFYVDVDRGVLIHVNM